MLCRRCRFALEARARSPAAHLPRHHAPPTLFRQHGALLSATSSLYASGGGGVAARPFHSGPVRWADSALAARRHDDVDADDGVEEASEAVDTDAAAQDAEEIWNSLLSEESAPTDAEVSQHIDGLRPTDETILPRSEFQRCADTLASGFTAVQLQAYIRKNTKSAAGQPTVYAWEVRRRPWVPDAATGDDEAAGAPRKGQAAEGQQEQQLLLRGYVTRPMTNKERLALQVLRGCWGLSVRELMDVPGHVDVVVRPLELALLAAGAQTWLPAISAAFSSVVTATATTSRSRSRSHSRSQTRQQRHIALLPWQRTLRVFAPQATADAILAEIDAKLRRARTRRFPLAAFRLATGAGNTSADESGEDGAGEDHAWITEAHAAAAAEAAEADGPETVPAVATAAAPSADVVEPDFREVLKADTDLLRALGTLTGSWVRVEDGDSVCVSWVDLDDAQPGAAGDPATPTTTADVGDTVFRLLLRAAHDWRAVTMRSGPVSVRLDHQRPPPSSGSAGKGRFLVETDDAVRAALPWYHRAGRWARWLEPEPTESLAARQRFSVKSPAPAALPLEFVIADNAAAAEADDASRQQRAWFRRSLVSTVATFGRVLHAQPAGGDRLLYPAAPAETAAPAAAGATTIADRILVPVAPPLLGLHLGQGQDGPPPTSPAAPTKDGSASSSNPVTTSTTIRLVLLPSPATGLAHYAPALEVLLDVPAQAVGEQGAGTDKDQADTADHSVAGRPVFSELRVIQSASICDTLFPTEPVDARLTQTRYSVLTAAELADGLAAGGESNTDVAAVLQFIEQSQPYLRAVLDTPETTTAGTAAKMASKKAGNPTASASAAAASLGMPAAVGALQLPQHVLHVKRRRADGYKPVTLAYVLAGLEVRRRVATAYAGWTLALTSVDGGPDGGRRTELTLEAVPAGNGTAAAAAAATDKQGFRSAVGAVATGRDLHWTLPVRMVV